MPRVAAIGLDAMEWEVVDQLIGDGQLPHLAALRERSTFCQLTNVVAYRSELPWTLFLSGRSPELNEYWSTVEFDPATYDVYTVGAHRAKPFYSLGADTKVIAFDVPHSVPDPGVNGVQVMAWGAHSAQYPRAAEPHGLLDEIDARFGPHPGFDNDYEGAWFVDRFVDKLTEAQVIGANRRTDIVQWLMEQHPDWDFLIAVMSEPHSTGHHLWHGIEPTHPLHSLPAAGHARDNLVRVYQAVDAQVGRLIESVGPDTTVVAFAVHGMQNNNNDAPSTVLLPELGYRAHFGRSLLGTPHGGRWKRAGFPTLIPSGRHPWETLLRRRFGNGLQGYARRAASASLPEPLMEMPLRLRRRLKRLPEPRPPWEFRNRFPKETDQTFEQIRDTRGSLQWQPPSWYRPYWPQMKWFVIPTFSDAHVRINLRGRERDGVVDPADYLTTIDEFESLVRACINPRTGNPAVEEVFRMRADDPASASGASADLVVLWAEPVDALEHPEYGLIGPVPFNRTGEHSSHGFAMIAGDGIEAGDHGVRSAYDLTTTILSLLGKPAEEGMLGTSILPTTAPSAHVK